MTHFNDPAVVEQDICTDFIARVPWLSSLPNETLLLTAVLKNFWHIANGLYMWVYFALSILHPPSHTPSQLGVFDNS